MFNLIEFEKIDSTNKYLKENYKSLDDLTFVSAEFQTAGRGRTSRVWESTKGENLLFSFLLKDEALISKFEYISLLVGNVVANEIANFGIDYVSVKWPNDVYIKDKKVCGILLEGVALDSKQEALIIGVGINCNQIKFSEDLNATSIKNETNKDVDIKFFKLNLFSSIIENLYKLNENPKFFLEDLRSKNYLKGKDMYATINNEKKKVTIIDINDDCSIKVSLENKIINLFAGELSFH